MPDEEIDKLINEAANQHHPPYDDKAWERMEALLEKHLPQKKDRRKYFLYLLTFLLVGGGVFLGIEKPWKNSDSNKHPINKNEVVNGTGDFKEKMPLSKSETGVKKARDISPENNSGLLNSGADSKNTVAVNTVTKNLQNTEDIFNLVKGSETLFHQKARISVKIKPASAVVPNEDNVDIQNTALSKYKKEIVKNNEPDVNEIDISATDNLNIDLQKQNDLVNANDTSAKLKTDAVKQSPQNNKKIPGKNQTKKDKSFASNFAITVSAGAEVNFININSAGKLQPVYGAGLRYAISKRFTISSALLVSKKIYAANPAQYKFPNGYTNPALIKINADCKIYEIPLSVYYKFGQVKNHNWFGAMGFSTYFMKNETYDYRYKNASGQTWNYEHTYKNENKHYLSVLSLSGGYQYKLSNRINLLAEPYIKLPLSGVGAGKIKLNSTGILFTAELKPFNKK